MPPRSCAWQSTLQVEQISFLFCVMLCQVCQAILLEQEKCYES